MDNTFEKRKKVIYDFICDDMYVPMKVKEMAIVLNIPKEERRKLKEILNSLVEDGLIHVSKKGKYTKGAGERLTGVFTSNPRGFGFIVVEGEEQDIFVSPDDINGAFEGDTVEYVITKQPAGKRKEGKVVSILSHGTVKVVGYFEKCKSFGFVRPDNQRILKDIYIPQGKDKGAMTGHKVVVELKSYGDDNSKPEGKVVEIIGHVSDPGVDIMSIVKGYDLPCEFGEKILNQAERVGKDVSDADMAGRADLRSWQMVTIDGDDAKDLDDAVSLTMEKGLYKLGVHIADVTNYVQEKSAIDREALNRGTSVYLADRVIPMLPHKLCNGICSLNAGESRLALSCIMYINDKGEVVDHEIKESVVNIDKRMSYKGVQKIIDENKEGFEGEKTESVANAELVPMILNMAKLSEILIKMRSKRGAINFDFPESKIVLDENGKPIDIVESDRK